MPAPRDGMVSCARYGSVVLLTLLLGGCAAIRPPADTARRIALLAPFEGRSREVGYDALYAARLALADASDATIELVALDDGGTPERAAQRAQAAALDPRISAVVVLGLSGASASAQHALGDIPALIVGHWVDGCASPSVHILSAPLDDAAPMSPELTVAAAQVGDSAALPAYIALRQAAGIPLAGVHLRSAGTPPDADFIARYRASDAFAPEPGLLATLTYDAVRWLAQTVQSAGTRGEVLDALSAVTYTGYHTLTLGACYTDLPIHTYIIADGAWAKMGE